MTWHSCGRTVEFSRVRKRAKHAVALSGAAVGQAADRSMANGPRSLLSSSVTNQYVQGVLGCNHGEHRKQLNERILGVRQEIDTGDEESDAHHAKKLSKPRKLQQSKDIVDQVVYIWRVCISLQRRGRPTVQDSSFGFDIRTVSRCLQPTVHASGP